MRTGRSRRSALSAAKRGTFRPIARKRLELRGRLLSIDLTPLEDGSDRVLRMMCHMDGGAQCDGIGENWVPHLESHGGVAEDLVEPVSVEWSDKSIVRQIQSFWCSRGKPTML